MSQKKPETLAGELEGRLLKAMEPHADTISRGLALFDEFRRRVRAAAEVLASRIEGPLAVLSEIDWVDVKRRLENLPEKSKKAMILASSKGWFFGWNDSLEDLVTLVEKLENVDVNEIDNILADYHRENFESGAQNLIANHPNRAAAISAAVHAHKSLGPSGYFLSTPVFIAQADGLLSEISKLKSPMSEKGLKELRSKIEKDPGSSDLLYPLLILDQLDFLKSESKRNLWAETTGQCFSALNRHQVIHGESSDYGTEINSLKAFSFLVFVGLHLPLILEGRHPTGIL
ncbi:hypothetical protein [Paraburkholderia bryophila]|uniref:Uncharacterized protein n=1 Tax=Paraburkholderia bryophila TaxID=420952 RepID=A0A329B564_9BURK|nr:hypothetical protein [Paraburkholderia bryophila]RAS15828.1 hypothetical protein BX591_15210 [Paraburkholderia bryophila]